MRVRLLGAHCFRTLPEGGPPVHNLPKRALAAKPDLQHCCLQYIYACSASGLDTRQDGRSNRLGAGRPRWPRVLRALNTDAPCCNLAAACEQLPETVGETEITRRLHRPPASAVAGRPWQWGVSERAAPALEDRAARRPAGIRLRPAPKPQRL